MSATETKTADQWVEYLLSRAKAEGIDAGKKADVYGWVTAGVGPSDDEEEVWSAFAEARRTE